MIVWLPILVMHANYGLTRASGYSNYSFAYSVKKVCSWFICSGPYPNYAPRYIRRTLKLLTGHFRENFRESLALRTLVLTRIAFCCGDSPMNQEERERDGPFELPAIEKPELGIAKMLFGKSSALLNLGKTGSSLCYRITSY